MSSICKAALICIVAAALPSHADCAPKHVVRIIARVEGLGIEPSSFASLPKTVFRLGSKYARIEEAPDTANKIHGLIVVNEPDSWIINLADGTGRHVVDQGPTTNVHIPLFSPGLFDATFPAELAKIEMGCEREFFESYRSPTEPLTSGSIRKVKQAVGAGKWMLVLVRPEVASPPETLFVFHDHQIAFVVHYVSYDTLASDDLAIFEKPKDITFGEASTK